MRLSGQARSSFRSICADTALQSLREPHRAETVEEALQLPPDDIDWIVESLLIKDKLPAEAALEAAWDNEIKRRLDEIDSGAVEMIPAEEVHAKMIARLSPEARARMRV